MVPRPWRRLYTVGPLRVSGPCPTTVETPASSVCSFRSVLGVRDVSVDAGFVLAPTHKDFPRLA